MDVRSRIQYSSADYSSALFLTLHSLTVMRSVRASGDLSNLGEQCTVLHNTALKQEVGHLQKYNLVISKSYSSPTLRLIGWRSCCCDPTKNKTINKEQQLKTMNLLERVRSSGKVPPSLLLGAENDEQLEASVMKVSSSSDGGKFALRAVALCGLWRFAVAFLFCSCPAFFANDCVASVFRQSPLRPFPTLCLLCCISFSFSFSRSF